MLDQKPFNAGPPLQLEAPASLRGFLTEPGRQSSDGMLQISDAAHEQAAGAELEAPPPDAVPAQKDTAPEVTHGKHELHGLS